MRRPKSDEYGDFYQNYVQKVPKGSLLSHLRRTFRESKALFEQVPEEKGNWRYAEGKWTIKELMMHLIDTERVFAYRALVFMRGDRAKIPGFMQDDYVLNSEVEKRTLKSLLKEWKVVRENTVFLYKQCSEEQSKRFGTASGLQVTPRALFCMIIGHHMHHLEVFQEKYTWQEG